MARPATQAVTASLRDQRARRVRRAFAELPDRYRGAPADTDHTFQIRLGDVGRTWEVRTRGDRCEVHPSPTRNPDVVIGTDAATWIALREGRMSGLDAFSQRRLYARGDLDLALGFEGMFRLPGDRDPLLRISRAETGCGRVTTLIAGDGPEHVICLHGLGSNKSSFFETVAALAGDHTVHAIDLPGFGSSAKPARAPYDAPWFAAAVLSYMEATGLERAHLIGNSMGGRIAIEVGFAAADRVASLSLLSPSLAFRRRQLAPLVRLLRPELAAIPHPLREATVRDQFWDLFAQPERLDPAAADIAVDEFCRIYRSRAARVAFFAAARNIYLDEPHGERGFYARLRDLEPPALFIWGEADRVIPPAFAKHVRAALPRAKQIVLADCGHVPQVELPERTNILIREHLAEASAAAEPELRGAFARALRRAV
jgi:pimeloyl-ACP methyl ester carboxylesterase/putative sterol carrier protein